MPMLTVFLLLVLLSQYIYNSIFFLMAYYAQPYLPHNRLGQYLMHMPYNHLQLSNTAFSPGGDCQANLYYDGINLQQLGGMKSNPQCSENEACSSPSAPLQKADGVQEPPPARIITKPAIKNDKFVQQKSNKLEDQYAVMGRLGSGVYGDVFKIKHKQLGLIRALKVIKKDPSKKYSQKEEIEVLKSLDHPNILKIYEFYELPNFFYIVTELFDGKQLFNEILDHGIFSQAKAAQTAYQILKALVYTHKRKIVHRDIKLQNILIKSVNNVITIKLIDWGFGSFVRNKLMRICGTPQYAAPDIFEGQYDEKCDIWSFGVLLYVLLSATFPFRGSSRDETISLIQKGKFSFHNDIWKGVSAQAKEFIGKLLTKKSQDRVSAEEAINSQWITKHLKRELNLADLKDTLTNFRQIYIRNNMAAAALSFITNYLSTQQQKQRLNQVFNMLDTNGDGVLSFQEIARGYEIVYGPLVGHAVAQQTFTKLDLNHNGVLEYHEFITYSLDLKKMISGQKMKAAFKLFDSNQDGKINLSEMKEIFSYDIKLFDEHKFKNWLDDLDSNGDGEIDENEFIKSLIQICNLVQTKRSDLQSSSGENFDYYISKEKENSAQRGEKEPEKQSKQERDQQKQKETGEGRNQQKLQMEQSEKKQPQ